MIQKKIFTRLTMEGHGRDTFRGAFHSNGSPILKLEPEDIIRQAQKFKCSVIDYQI